MAQLRRPLRRRARAAALHAGDARAAAGGPDPADRHVVDPGGPARDAARVAARDRSESRPWWTTPGDAGAESSETPRPSGPAPAPGPDRRPVCVALGPAPRRRPVGVRDRTGGCAAHGTRRAAYRCSARGFAASRPPRPLLAVDGRDRPGGGADRRRRRARRAAAAEPHRHPRIVGPGPRPGFDRSAGRQHRQDRGRRTAQRRDDPDQDVRRQRDGVRASSSTTRGTSSPTTTWRRPVAVRARSPWS